MGAGHEFIQIWDKNLLLRHVKVSISLCSFYILTLSEHALERYSSHFVCLSVADLKDGGLLALQRDTNLKSTTL